MAVCAAALVAMAGCGSGGVAGGGAGVSGAAVVGARGAVHGGQQPVSGATIGLWAVNTNGTVASSVLTGPVTSDSNGNFSLAGLIACPTTTAQVYLTANGGNPGLTAGTNNGALALMTAVGACSSITTSSFIQVNEVTTVAAVWALQQFMGVVNGTPFAETVGVTGTASTVTGMVNAFATAQNLANYATGSAGGTNANAAAEVAKIDTIANILGSCVNSDGTTACTTLFGLVSPTGQGTAADTIQAALSMAQNPTENLSALFGLQSASPAFQPTLTAAPFDWTLGITYTGSGLNVPAKLAIDASGDVWIDSPEFNAGLVELLPNGQAAAGSPFLAGSSSPIVTPQNLAVDGLGSIWVANFGGGNVLRYVPVTNSYSTLPAPSTGAVSGVAVDGAEDVFFGLQRPVNSQTLLPLYEYQNIGTATVPAYAGSASALVQAGLTPYFLAVDVAGNVWVPDQTNGALWEVTPSSPAASTAYGLFTSPRGVALDHSGDVWVANDSSSSPSVAELVPANGSYGGAQSFPGAGLASPVGIAVDGAGYIWAANSGATTLNGTTYVSASKLSNTGAPVSPDASGTQPGGFAKTTTATSPVPNDIAIDPSGNVWMTGCASINSCKNGSSFVLELVGAASPVVTPLAVAQGANQLGCCGNSPPAPGATTANPAGQVTLGAATYAPTQNAGSFSFAVYRVSGAVGAATVQYATSAGSAAAGTDYTAESGTLTWANGDSSVKTITVPWLDASNYSGAKTFSVVLSNATGASLGTYGNTVVSVTDNLKPPYPTFNFGIWKLQLPVDIYGGNGGVNGSQFESAEVSSSVLDSGFSDPYFYLNGANQIVFTAPANGATTSPGSGSNHTRSELRELYTGTGADANSDWNSTIGGTMTASVQVASVAPASPEATIGQIHGQSATFVVLQYRTSGTISLQLYATPTATSSTNTTLLSGVSLNDAITYTLQYSGNTVTATVNDVTKGTSSTTPFSVPSWAGQPVYFKVGAYHDATNTGNGAGDQTQVIVKSVSVTHP